MYNRKRLEGTYNFNHPALAAAANCIYYCDRSLLKDAVDVITCLMKFHGELGVGEIYVRSDSRPFRWHRTRVTIMAELEIRPSVAGLISSSLESKLWSY